MGWSDFAQTLERELAALKAQLEEKSAEIQDARSLAFNLTPMRSEHDAKDDLCEQIALLVERFKAQLADREKDARRLRAMMPLFEEARDAITAIPLAAAKLRNIRLDLADRMDEVGVPERWAAMNLEENNGTSFWKEVDAAIDAEDKK